MIQKESRLEVADNSGAKVAMVIGVLGVSTATGRFTRASMGVGDRVICAIKDAIPNGQVKSGDKAEAVIVRVKSPTRRSDGSYVRFDSNACVLVDKEGNPKGTLQEILQAIGSEAPSYRIVGESGPDHRKVFHAQVFWNGLLLAQGRGKSKKEAEVRAATEALRKKIWLNAEAS